MLNRRSTSEPALEFVRELSPKYAPVQNVAGHIVFFSDFLRKAGFKIKSAARFTAVPIEIARQYALI
jgi:uncharacterized protein with von Willebrand factor type A (vWA) domain